jgi:ribosomal protein S18 acetylase RimI-like enzyme
LASPETTSPSPALAVRAGEPRDGPFIIDLARRVFGAYGSYDRYVREWLGSPQVLTLVAEADGVPAGAALLAASSPGEAQLELLAIGVEPAVQGRGVGSLLLRQAISLARTLPAQPPRRRVREIRLTVAEGNARAERLFARHGFRVLPGAGIYPAGQRARLMVKTLEPSEPSYD